MKSFKIPQEQKIIKELIKRSPSKMGVNSLIQDSIQTISLDSSNADYQKSNQRLQEENWKLKQEINRLKQTIRTMNIQQVNDGYQNIQGESRDHITTEQSDFNSSHHRVSGNEQYDECENQEILCEDGGHLNQERQSYYQSINNSVNQSNKQKILLSLIAAGNSKSERNSSEKNSYSEITQDSQLSSPQLKQLSYMLMQDNTDIEIRNVVGQSVNNSTKNNVLDMTTNVQQQRTLLEINKVLEQEIEALNALRNQEQQLRGRTEKKVEVKPQLSIMTQNITTPEFSKADLLKQSHIFNPQGVQKQGRGPSSQYTQNQSIQQHIVEESRLNTSSINDETESNIPLVVHFRNQAEHTFDKNYQTVIHNIAKERIINKIDNILNDYTNESQVSEIEKMIQNQSFDEYQQMLDECITDCKEKINDAVYFNNQPTYSQLGNHDESIQQNTQNFAQISRFPQEEQTLTAQRLFYINHKKRLSQSSSIFKAVKDSAQKLRSRSQNKTPDSLRPQSQHQINSMVVTSRYQLTNSNERLKKTNIQRNAPKMTVQHQRQRSEFETLQQPQNLKKKLQSVRTSATKPSSIGIGNKNIIKANIEAINKRQFELQQLARKIEDKRKSQQRQGQYHKKTQSSTVYSMSVYQGTIYDNLQKCKGIQPILKPKDPITQSTQVIQSRNTKAIQPQNYKTTQQSPVTTIGSRGNSQIKNISQTRVVLQNSKPVNKEITPSRAKSPIMSMSYQKYSSANTQKNYQSLRITQFEPTSRAQIQQKGLDGEKKRNSIGLDEVFSKVNFSKACSNCSRLLSKGLSSALCNVPHI